MHSGSGRPPLSANEEQLSNIFKESHYIEVPRFQRSYSWDVEETSAFWDDVHYAFSSSSGHVHFLGAIVFSRHTSRPARSVLDGQQRLTTLMLLAAALAQEARNLPDSDEATLLVEDLSLALRVTVTMEGKAQRVTRLQANRQDRPFFEALIKGEGIPTVKHNSHRLMLKAYQYLRKQVEDLAQADGGDPLMIITRLWDAIRNQLWYIDITCEQEINPQVVFESLNAKGQDLTSADLIKNFLLLEIERHGSEANVDEADRSWTEMVNSIGNDSWLPNYVHAYWSSNFSYARNDEIYTALKREVASGNQTAKGFLDGLCSEAETYAELRNPTDGFWGSKATARMLREMSSLNIRVTHAVLLALWEVVDDVVRFETGLRRLLNFMVRYSKITEQPSNWIDRELSSKARELRAGKVSPDEFYAWLRRESPTPQQFIESFKTLSIKSGPTARLILMKINNALNSDSEPEAMIADTEKVTLEHIIPRTPNPSWEQVLNEDDAVLDEIINRVGNLTLLTGPKNKTASNREFEYKRDQIYAGSSLPLNQDLVRVLPESGPGQSTLRTSEPGPLLDRFGVRELTRRQAHLAEIAESIWTVD